MPNIKPVDREKTDKETAATLDAVEKKLGMLPNLFATFARSPAALNSYLQITETLAKGQLTARQREMIAVAVAQDNACEYCLSAHTAIGRKAGLSESDIELARRGEATEQLDKAITHFALRVAQTKATLSKTEMAVARQSGMSDELIVEVIANVAMNVMTNYLNRIAGTEIDFPLVRLAEAA